MWSCAAVALKKSKVFSTSSSTLSLIARSTGRASSKVAPCTSWPFLSCSAASYGKIQFLLHGFGIRVAASRDVAREDRLRTGEDVDVDGAGAGIEQRDDAGGVETVIHLERVLQREGIDVHDEGRLAGLGDDARIRGDLVFLRGDEQHVHAALALGPGAGIEDFVVERDVLDVEGDVLLGFPEDRVGELALGVIVGSVIFLTITDVPDSDATTCLALNLLLENSRRMRVGDRAAVHDGAVDDAVGRNGLDTDGGHFEGVSRRFQLDGLDEHSTRCPDRRDSLNGETAR